MKKGWLPTLASDELPLGGFTTQRVDFARVVPWRLAQLRRAAAGFFAHARPADRQAYAHWCQTQADWLDDYALFMAIRSPLNGQPWWEWAAPLARREPGSGDSDFFICLGEAPYLDANPAASGDNLGFAAFGQVIQGNLLGYDRICRMFLFHLDALDQL